MNAPTEAPAVQLLRKFCAGSDDNRTYMQAPHIISGRAVATDGKWFVVLPAGTSVDGLESADDKYNPNDLIQIADAFDGAFTPAREIGVKTIECSSCAGTGKRTNRVCHECDGDGEFVHGSHWYECRACDGSGALVSKGHGDACCDCDGRGFSTDRAPSTLGDHALGISAASNYVEALRGINGEISTAPLRTKGYGYLWALRFPGGRGLLMPMRGEPCSLHESDLAAEAHCDG